MERRNRLDLMELSEKAILNAIDEVEKVGAHPMLTDVILQLQNAKDKLSDYIDADAQFFGATNSSTDGDPVPPDPTHPKP